MNDWQRVGLPGPSLDLGTIKRAYARTLRQTRPDDDAAAYQALREAYDRLVNQARWAAHEAAREVAQEAEHEAAHPVVWEAAEAPVLETVMAEPARADAEPSAPAPEPVRPPNADVEAISLPAPRSPEALCQALREQVRQRRSEWRVVLPALQRDLNEQPLSVQFEASVRFARLVVEGRGHWPAELLQLLHQHFGWLDDYRTERVLGSELAGELKEALSDVSQPLLDPQVREQHAEVLALGRQLQAKWTLRPIFTLLGLGFRFQSQLAEAGPALLRRLGLDGYQQGRISQLTNWADWLQVAVLGGLVFLAALLAGYDSNAARWLTAYSIALGVLTQVPLLVLLGLSAKFRESFSPSPRWRRRLGLDRRPATAPLIGVACFVVAAALDFTPFRTNPWSGAAGGLLALVGLTMALPPVLPLGGVALGLWAYAAWAWHPPQVGAYPLIAAWTFGGALAYQYGWLRPESRFDAPWRERPRWGWWSLPLLATAGLPVLLSSVALRGGLRILIAALVLGSLPGMVMQHQVEPPRWALPVWLLASLAVLLVLQHLAWMLTRRALLRHAPDPG